MHYKLQSMMLIQRFLTPDFSLLSIMFIVQLPLEKDAMGLYTPAGLFFLAMRLLCPLAYVYIALIILREISDWSPIFQNFTRNYIPPISSVIDKMKTSSIFVEVWVFIEAIFYIIQRLHIRYLQYKDPLEASLSAAPILTLEEREKLMNKILMQIHGDDPVSYLRGWFFDEELENISRYDICDFLAWSQFEGRNQEHLTKAETGQLLDYLIDLEWVISIQLYGADPDAEENRENEQHRAVIKSLVNKDVQKRSGKDSIPRVDSIHYRMHGLFDSINKSNETLDNDSSHSSDMDDFTLNHTYSWEKDRSKRIKPRRNFHFLETTHDESPVFFTNLYENYKQSHEQYHDQFIKLENLASRFQEAEENAIAAASSIYENAYSKFIDKGSAFDKRIQTVSDVMHNQLNDAWNSMWNMKERLETATFVTTRKRALNSRLKGYDMLLEKTITSSNDVPTRQVVDLMKKITQCNESLEAIEHSATNAFLKAMRLDVSHLLVRKEPQRYAKYSEDPLMGLAIYPLVFNLAIYFLTDGLTRHMLKQHGFQRHCIGSTVYYYHEGINADQEIRDDDDDSLIPIVFCHGIGVGIGYYSHLIDMLVKSGHPIFLPEIPYVCGFRPWVSRKSILTPHAVVATVTAMLASHGHMKATFIGHSYGTSWLSYMCKYAKDALAAVVFLDPICFCIHHPCLTKSFVYHRADPGSVSYFVKTDVIINWTIQRSFPWSRIILFVDDIPDDIPCSIFLSEYDNLIPVETVKNYLKSNGAHVCDYKEATPEHFSKGPVNVTMLRGQGHGDWTLCSDESSLIADTARLLTEQAECGKGDL